MRSQRRSSQAPWRVQARHSTMPSTSCRLRLSEARQSMTTATQSWKTPTPRRRREGQHHADPPRSSSRREPGAGAADAPSETGTLSSAAAPVIPQKRDVRLAHVRCRLVQAAPGGAWSRMWPGIHAAGGGLRYRVYGRWVGREEARGHRSLEGSARRVGGACRRSRPARCSRCRCDRCAGRACLGDGRRDSDSGAERGERHLDGVRLGDARRDARLPLPRRRLTSSDRPCHGLGGARPGGCDGGDRLGRPSLRRAFRRHPPDRHRSRPCVAPASDGAVADTSLSHVVHVRLDGDPVELVPGKKLWVKGWGYAVVDDPVARARLGRRRRHARRPAAAPDLGALGTPSRDGHRPRPGPRRPRAHSAGARS